jgi:hypothetical protein
MYCGKTKPPLDFLTDFIDEMRELQNNGLQIDNSCVPVVIDNFVCDAPARSFIKCTKLHSGYSSCEKCSQHGEWLGKVVFTEFDAPLRTDDSFRSKVDDGHHSPVFSSPLTTLNIGMVTQFPLDPMHLLYLGVMRRLLLSWMRGPFCVRISQAACTQMSTLLLGLRSFIPREFCRRPRALSEIDRWKATEFRQFLLYTGAVAIRKIVDEKVYKHFLLLHTASFILSSKKLSSKFCDYAESLMRLFVQGIGDIYGNSMLVYNVHGLLHLANDVRRFGDLDNFSAFPFENKLKDIKKLVRKPNNPLQQVVRRIFEQQFLENSLTINKKPSVVLAKQEHCSGPVPNGYSGALQYCQITLN